MMSCFNKMLDCLDILEVVVKVWHEDYFSTMSVDKKKSIVEMMRLADDFAIRIYPVIFSDGFGYSSSRRTETAVGDKSKYELRRSLLLAALRFNSAKAKVKVERPPEQLTTFKPFNIREIEYEIWQEGTTMLQVPRGQQMR